MAMQNSDRHHGPRGIGDLLPNGLGKLALKTKAGHCDTHGDYIDKQMRGIGPLADWWTGCPQCRQINMAANARIAQAAQMEQDRAEAAALRAAATAQRLAASGVPRRFANATWGGYRTTDTSGTEAGTQAYALARAKAYADNFKRHLDSGRTLMMLGNHGTGKNYLATCIARQVAEAGHSVVFTTAEQMLMAWRDVVVHKVQGSKGELALLRDFAAPQLLVLDEMFRQSDSAAAQRFLFEVLNARYADCLPTVIISNKDSDDIKALLDPVLLSRLLERGAIMIPFLWEDQRPNEGRGAG